MPFRSASFAAFAAAVVAASPAAASAHAPRPVRALVSVYGGSISAAHASPALRGRLNRRDLAALRLRSTSVRARQQIAVAQKHRRELALLEVSRGSARAGARLAAVARRLRGVGATIETADPLTGALTIDVAAGALARISGWRDVASVLPAPPKPHALAHIDPPYSVGADAWWNAGYTGGTGAADVTALAGRAAANLVINDMASLQEDHPAFAGIKFEDPPGAATHCANDTYDCPHPSEVLTFAVGRPVPTCPVASGYVCNSADLDADNKGMAPGVDYVLDPDTAGASWPSGEGYAGLAWAYGITQYGMQGGVLPGAAHPGQIENNSTSSGTATADDTTQEQGADMVTSQYGVMNFHACGNGGPGPSTVDRPSIAYDSVCVGAFDVGSSATDPSDDTIYSWSSVGPTPAGRKKPDLVAVGGGVGANYLWQSSGSLWNGVTGTSFASPQAAGGGLLLMGSGITDPLAVKAILIDSARQGRATAASAMGTQTGWQPDWGWGELDMADAFAQRTNFDAATVKPNSARYYRASTTTAGDRATLVWNRRVSGDVAHRVWGGNPMTAYPLSNLNLFEYDSASGAQRGASTSTIDNVEQVRSPGADTIVYKVTAGAVQGATAEPYALAATRQVTPLVTPEPVVAVSSDKTTLGPADSANVTVTVTNPSPDLAATGFAETVSPSNGIQATEASTDAAAPTTLAAGQSYVRHYTVRGNADGSSALNVNTSGTAYGTTLTGTGQRTFAVDLSGPAATAGAPYSPAPGPFTVSWGAVDPSGVASYEVQAATDGGSFAAWTSGPATSASWTGQAGHRYRFRVRATDTLGNLGAWAETGDAAVPLPVVVLPPLSPVLQPPIAPTLQSAGLRISSLAAAGRVVTVRGALNAAAAGVVKVSARVRVGAKTVTVTTTAHPVRGVFVARIRLRAPGRLLSATARYGGSSSFRAATASRTAAASRKAKSKR